jgi:PD-(D/E)XK nuclease superfamily/Domain of unknown function (DUF2357)
LRLANLIPYKIVNGAPEPLRREREGWACSEGEVILLETHTNALPILRMAGHKLQPQQIIQIDGCFDTRYELLIDIWAGRTTLELEDGALRSAVTLEVAPHQRKLGLNEFEEMLAELSGRSSGLIWGLSPGTRGGIMASAAPAVVHPVVISSQLSVFERLLSRFLDDPPTVTQRTREAYPLDLAHRADLSTLRWLGRKPAVLRALRGDGIVGSFTNLRTPVEQPKNVSSYNHPVTRYVAFLLVRLLARFRESAHKLRCARGRPFRDVAIEAHAEALASRMDAAANWLEGVLARPLFRQVKPEPMGETALQSVEDQPLYSALQRVARRMLDPGLAYGPSGDLESALKHTYDLFELFVLYRLIDELPKELGEGWELKAGKPLSYTGREERPGDRAAWLFQGPDGLTLELRYQQWFSRARMPPDDRLFASLSGVNIPDYILVLRSNGRPVSWVILDAKYRSGQQAVDQGLGDVHRYRDALRVRGMRACGAFVIVPRLQKADAVYAASSYHEHHTLGVLQLFSAGWLSQACRRLTPSRAGRLVGV